MEIMRSFRAVLAAISLLAVSTATWGAQQILSGNGITLTYDDTTCGVSAPTCNSLMQSGFNSSVNQFQLNALKDYLKYMSSAQSMATKGQGVDYTTNPSMFVFGASVGLAVDVGSQTLSYVKDSLSKSGSIPAFGAGYQFSVMGGVNLGAFKMLPAFGPFDLKKLSLYMHAGGYNFSDLIKQDGVTAKSSQFGMHAKYKVIDPKSMAVGLFNWGGIDLITGVTIASNTITYQRSFDEQSTGSGTLTDPQIKIKPAGTIGIDNGAVAVPFEIATSVRLLYILSLFGGAGIDLNFGKTTVDMAVSSSSITTTVNGNPNTVTGNLKIAATDSSGGRFGDVRFFTGFALNIVPLKNTNVLSLIGQANISTGGGYGAMLGVRAGW